MSDHMKTLRELRDERYNGADWTRTYGRARTREQIIALDFALSYLAAETLREKASVVEGFDAWVVQKQKEQATPLYNYDLTICREAYAAGRAAASERVAELEAEHTLLVAEVRRCWGLAESESSGDWVVINIQQDKPAEVRAIVEAQNNE